MHAQTILAFLAACCTSLAVTLPPISANSRPVGSSSDYAFQKRADSASAAPKIHGPAAAYATDVKHFDCGTNLSHATPHFLNTIHSLHSSDLENYAHGGSSALAARQPASTSITVPLYMHIVTTTANAKMVTAAQATQQFKTLNTNYAPYGVQFVLKNTSWTVNDAWAIGATTTDDTNMKTALRQGTYGSLNLYFQSDLAGGVLGKCTLPTSVGTNPPPAVYTADGCNIALGTMPSGPILGYNLGKTAVHETGHWLGLLHTFEGYSCTGTGDFVSDTPAESQSTNGCPTSPWKNTCSNRAGVDPIHNFMDYSTDACYEKFTPGQQSRIHTMWGEYRQGM